MVLAVAIVLSCFAGMTFFTASASDQTMVYFKFPTDGAWGDPASVKPNKKGKVSIYCHITSIYGDPDFTAASWQGVKEQCYVTDTDGIYSYDTSILGTLVDGADYGLIFATTYNGCYQTCQLTFSTDCLGDIVELTTGTRENPIDSSKVDYYATYQNHGNDYGPIKVVTSLGNVTDGVVPYHQPAAQLLSNALVGYLINPTNDKYFKLADNQRIAAELGVTTQAVYNQYKLDQAEILANGESIQYEVANNGTTYTYDAVSYNGTTIPSPAYMRERLGAVDEQPTTEAPTTVKPTTAPVTTVKPTTAPVTTVKPTTAPVTTVKPTTAPVTTVKPTTAPVTTVKPTTVPATTVKPTTVPVATTAPVDTLTVTAKSNYFPETSKTYGNPVGKQVDVSYYLKNTSKDLVNAQFEVNYDPAVLSYSDDNNKENNVYTLSPLANAKNGTAYAVNATTAGKLIISFVNIHGIDLNSELAFADIKFDIIGLGNKSTDVTLDITMLSVCPDGQASNIDNWVVADSYSDEFAANLNSTKQGSTLASAIDSDAGEVEPGLAMGDVNKDGKVDINDVTTLQKWLAKLIDFDAEQLRVADFNGNGAINIIDATAIQKFIASTGSKAVYTLEGTTNLGFENEWSTVFDTPYVMTKSGDKYTYTFTGLKAGSFIYAFKVVEWPNGSDEDEPIVYGSNGTHNTSYNFDFSLDADADVTVTFDPSTHKATMIGNGVVPPKINVNTVVVAGNGEDTWLNGVGGFSPDSDANRMTEISDGVYKLVCEEIYSFDNFQFKFAANDSWTINWGGEISEDDITRDGDVVTITSDAVYNGSDITLEVEEDDSTVEITLDLRNFDPSTKEGAKFTVVITPQ